MIINYLINGLLNLFIATSYAKTKGYYQYNLDGGAVGLLQGVGPLAQLLANPTLGQALGPVINPLISEAVNLTASPSFTRIFDKRNANATNFNLQQNFIGNFKIGDLKNRFVGGLDFINRSQHSKNQNGSPEITQFSNLGITLGFLENPQAFVPSLDPATTAFLQGVGGQIRGGFNAFPYFDAFLDAQGNVVSSVFTPDAKYATTKNTLDNAFKNVPVTDIRTHSKTYAAYVSNVLNITPELTVNLGLRLDYFDQNGDANNKKDDYTKMTLSPKAGIVYQVIPNELSIFGNYQTGFINVDPVINQVGEITVFQPKKANQFEGGLKTNLFSNKLNLGASYYHIIANNVTTTDPMAFLSTNQIDLKEVVSKGVEFELNANLINGLNLRVSYAYNDTKITDTNSVIAKRDVVELLDRRPEEAGPQTTYNFWADYKFRKGSFLEKFGLGAGFNGASEHLTINNAISGTFTLPEYTVYNAGLYYNSKKVRVGLKMNNLTNKTYYKGWSTVNAQAPRAFLASFTLKF